MIQIFYNEEYNLNHLLRLRELNEWFAAIKSRGDKALILDCGANIGLASKYLATEWHGAVVWAVEPSRRNAELAQSNLPEGARLVLGAIGPEDGACYIANPDANPNAYRISTSKEAVGHQSVPMISMSTFIKEAHSGGLEPFILKVDIEGAESALFENANDWLHRWPVLMIELHDWMLPKSASSSAVLKAIAEARRDVVLNGNTLVSLRNGGS
jgi:FkbM family methyltransferase